jgi:transcriptional regulator with XRE-family HTH domain
MFTRGMARVIRRLRQTQGMTQMDLAKRAKVSQAYVALLEAGEKDNPSLAVLRRLAKALKVDVARLLR